MKTGVILLNMGGPESLDEVRPFLYNLFSDRQIIQLGPKLLQKPLAWLISRRRAAKSSATYEKIGGGSPLIRITGEQASALQRSLQDFGDYIVVTAMRYCEPGAGQALQQLVDQQADKIVALPLYPHYCHATSGSSLHDLNRTNRRLGTGLKIEEIHGWADNSYYIKALSENLFDALQNFDSQEVEIVYSAHSLPVSFIDNGDPYLDQLEMTISALEKLTGVKGRLCFQSRSGPVEWLAPSTPEMLDTLAKEGCKNIVMVPISFVSDHVETLYEIDILYRDMAKSMGMECRSCASLNTRPAFIDALRNLVLSKSKVL